MIPSANTVARERPPPSASYSPKKPAARRVPDEVGQRGDIDARRGDVRADPVDDERQQGEQELALQLLVHGEVGNAWCGHLLLDLTAGRFDLRARRRGKGDASDGVGPVGVTGAEQLHRESACR